MCHIIMPEFFTVPVFMKCFTELAVVIMVNDISFEFIAIKGFMDCSAKTNNILDDSDRGIAWLLGDLDGFPLGQTDGFPVGTSAGASVGKSEDQVHRPVLQLRERDLDLKNFTV